MRILLLDLGSASLEAVNAALAGQGYQIFREMGLNAEGILALSPQILITEATPSDLSCCALITQLTSRPQDALSLKIVMIANGGALERARALDLGTDDVISFPFDAVEFAARIRTQLRERRPERRHPDAPMARMYGEAASKRRYWLIPGLFALGAVAILAAFIGISSRDSHRDTLQLRAQIARLNSNLQPQEDLLRRIEQARRSTDAKSDFGSAVRNSLKAQSEDLRKRSAAAGGPEADSLKQQLLETQRRLALLEREGRIAENVVHKYGPGVCLLHVGLGFLDRQSRQPILVAVDASGKPRIDDNGMIKFGVGGKGPRFQIDAFGTGFLAAVGGIILTNHHVVEPWWQNDELKQLLAFGVDPYVLSYEAYFPGMPVAFPAKLDRISSQADVATLRLEAPPPVYAEPLELDGRGDASVTGDPVVLIGYPTGVEGILARADPAVAQKIAGGTQDVDLILSRLASQSLIRPITTQGHIGDILKDKIVYDAATTSGGSGGPLFNRDGKVIGITFAIIKDFGGSNLAVPARYATDLLK